ncbi:hypothetical protein EYZ11_005898 [Aspergillus tanneri]|uniref:Uncharacterized protein n=1 Tax=Aspergillus tanneri TaxID=1220188 RepID=A0A4S3JH78_9EURO|nr:hypothetical protein EYZ11_005898 [Aspergillus tanneri]
MEAATSQFLVYLPTTIAEAFDMSFIIAPSWQYTHRPFSSRPDWKLQSSWITVSLLLKRA